MDWSAACNSSLFIPSMQVSISISLLLLYKSWSIPGTSQPQQPIQSILCSNLPSLLHASLSLLFFVQLLPCALALLQSIDYYRKLVIGANSPAQPNYMLLLLLRLSCHSPRSLGQCPGCYLGSALHVVILPLWCWGWRFRDYCTTPLFNFHHSQFSLYCHHWPQITPFIYLKITIHYLRCCVVKRSNCCAKVFFDLQFYGF